MTYNIFPKGALTHHLVVASCISFALPQAAGLAHSAAPPLPTKQALWAPWRWYGLRPPCALRGGTRRLRTPFSQYRCARLTGQLAYVSQRPAWLHHAGAQAHLASCGRKPATGRFPAWRKGERGTTKETEMIPNSDLPPGGEGHQPRRGTLRCRGCGLHELLTDLQ